MFTHHCDFVLLELFLPPWGQPPKPVLSSHPCLFLCTSQPPCKAWSSPEPSQGLPYFREEGEQGNPELPFIATSISE